MKLSVEINPDIITGIGDYLCKSKGMEKNDTMPNAYVVDFLADVLATTIKQCADKYDEIVDLQDACLEASSCLDAK